MKEGSIELIVSQSDHWAINPGSIQGHWEVDAAGEEIYADTAFAINDKVFGNQGVQFQYNDGAPRGYVGDGANAFWKFDGEKLTWKGANTELDATGNLTCTGGTIGGWTINATTLANSTNIILDAANKKISINNATYGNDGIQLEYNAGNPRAYIGDGANQYVQFDGANLSWKGTNTELTAAGELTCSNINATGGTVGGFTLAATTLTATNLLLDAGNQEIKLGSGNDIISLDAADATYRLAIGHATYGSAPFRVTKAGAVTAVSGTIGGWTLAATTLSSANITLDQGNDKITVNTITIDGANDRIRSGNYVSGAAGAGFTVGPDLVEAGNIAARGIFRAAVFQKDVISAIGGNIAIGKGSDVLATDMTAADASTMTIEGNETFEVGDMLRIKDDSDDEWFEVTNAGSAPTYTVTRDKDGDYGADANPAWKKGATVVNYGASGDGLVFMTASESNAPYVSIHTHAGAPWDTLVTQVRMGELNGSYGYSSSTFGAAFGSYTVNDCITIDATNGIRFIDASENVMGQLNSGEWTLGLAADAHISITSSLLQIYEGATMYTQLSGGVLTLGDPVGGEYLTISGVDGISMYGGGIQTFELTNAGAFWAGDTATTERIAWDITNGLYIANASNVKVFTVNTTGDAFFAGAITIGDGSTVSGTITLNIAEGQGDCYIAAGKSDFTTADAGFILGQDDSDSNKAKFYLGDATNYFYWDGSNIKINVASATAIEVKGGGDITFTGADVSPGLLVWDSAIQFYIGAYASSSYLSFYPETAGQGTVFFGHAPNSAAQAFNAIYMRTDEQVRMTSYLSANNDCELYVSTPSAGIARWSLTGSADASHYAGIYYTSDGTGDLEIFASETINLQNVVTVGTSLTLPNEGLHLLDTDSSHDLVIKPGSDLTADRILTITTGDAARTLTLSGNATLNDWFDQSVKQAASPTFAALTVTGAITSGGDAIAKIKTGSYTGDGTTSQAITGVGFTPKFLMIWDADPDGGTSRTHFTTTEMMARDPQGLAIANDAAAVTAHDNRIISLDADGFTVSDDGANVHPNANGQVYEYIAFG